MNQAEKDLYNPDYGAYPEYKSAFDTLEGMIKKVISDHGKLKGIKLSPKLEWGSALIDGVNKNMTAKYLSDSIRQQLSAIETQGNHVAFLWLDVQAAWYAYYNAVGAYNYTLRHDYNASDDELVGIREPSKETPTPLYFCYGSCDQLFETASAAQVSHQVYCPEKHGSSGTTGVTFYACSGSCGRSAEHWRVCGGTCGNKYAPKRINRGQGNYSYVADSPHYVKCEKKVYDFWNPNATCGEEYYTCQYSTCPKSNTHWSGSTPPQPTDNTPNCQDCTSHCSSPCSCTNSGTCNGTVVDNTPNCSGCTSHCSSPCSCSDSGTCNGTVAAPPPPPPEPEPPTLVACGARGWTGCTTLVSSRTEHKVESCSSCGKTYWTCSQYASNHTSEKECRYTECGNTWKKCGRAPSCEKPYRKRNGLKCWAK